MRASLVTWLMRPVSRAYRFWADVSVADEAPGKFVPSNIANAGSVATTAKLAVGRRVWFLAHNVYCVVDGPVVVLWARSSHVTFPSARLAVAVRCGVVGVLAGAVRV